MNKGVVQRAIVTPDKHFPLADKKAINVVCKAIKLVKPDTYIDLGDTGEWELFSRHYWKNKEKPPLEVLIPMLKDSRLISCSRETNSLCISPTLAKLYFLEYLF